MTATRIDPDELLPSNPEGKAASVPEFHDVVIAAINEHADEIEARVSEATDYGATGDGDTDDTSAMQRALDNSRGKVLRLRKGKYKITSTLHISTTCHRIVGDLCSRAADGGTEIMYTGTGPLFEIGSDNGHAWDAADYDGPQDQWFENLWLSHGSPDTALDMGGAIGSYKAGAYAIRDWRGGGIRLKSVGIEHFECNFWGIQSDINEFDDVTSLYSHYGIYAGPRSDQFTLRNLYSFFCDQAVTIDGEVNGFRLVDPQIVGCGTATKCAVDIAMGASGVRIVRPWFEHLQGYTGTNQAGFVAAGITAGYGNNTNSAKKIAVENAQVLTNVIGAASHTRCIIRLGKANDVRLYNPASAVGTSDGLNLDAWIIAPSGTSYSSSDSSCFVFGSDASSPPAEAFANEGSGSPFFQLFADHGSTGMTLYTGGTLTVYGHETATGRIYGIDGLQLKTVAGAVSDGSFTASPPDGTIAIDTTNSKIYVRIGGTWKSVTVT